MIHTYSIKTKIIHWVETWNTHLFINSYLINIELLLIINVHCHSKFWTHIYMCIQQGRNHGIDIGGVQMWALPQIFFLKFSRGSDRKKQTGQAINKWRGLSMEWEVRELLGLWLQQFIIHYLLFRCLLAYRRKKKAPPKYMVVTPMVYSVGKVTLEM